jgi:putative transcriptional regulator
MSDEFTELKKSDFERGIPHSVRQRIIQGEIRSGNDIALLRSFLGMTQLSFSQALGISVHTLRNWEQDRRTPEGPALALLRIAARHPGVLRENLAATA